MILVAMRKILSLALFGFVVGYGSVGHAQAGDTQQTQLAAHLHAAQRFMAAKQPEKAIPELQAVVVLQPENVEARANLGVLLYFENRFEEAIPQLKAAVTINPQLWKIQSLLGIAERRAGDEADGRADLETAFPNITEEKLKVEVGRNLIESYAATNDLDKASQTIAVLLRLEPNNPALLYISYRIHSDMAVSAMLELGLAAPNSAEAHQAMAHELQRDHDLPATIANLRAALKLDPNLPGIHFELAEALHASDDQRLRAESEGEYRLAVKTNPGDPKAATRMGDIEVEKGNMDAGAEDYRRALKLQPGQADASIGLANVLNEQGKPAEAATLLEQVEASDPTNVLAHYRLSAVYRKLKRPADVKRELELYQKYKAEREKLKAVYQQMRVTSPQGDDEKK